MNSLKPFFFLLGISLCSAQEVEPQPKSAPLPLFLRQFDTNEDGVIDEEERQALRDLRADLRRAGRESIDTNNDGDISDEEILAAREILRTAIEDRRLAKFREVAGEDDLITYQEYLQIPGLKDLPDFLTEALFDRLDHDASGDITVDEFFNRLRSHEQKASRSTTKGRRGRR